MTYNVNMFSLLSIIPQAFADGCNPGSGSFKLTDCIFLGKDTSKTVADVYDTPSKLINTIVSNIFIFAGIILLLTIIFAGFKLISGEKGLEDARSILKVALIGFIVMFIAYWMILIVETVTGIAIFSPVL